MKANIITILVFVVLIALAVLFISGCVLYRHDREPDRDSRTFWTLMKDISVAVDPNSGITYTSTSNRFRVVTPYVAGETK